MGVDVGDSSWEGNLATPIKNHSVPTLWPKSPLTRNYAIERLTQVNKGYVRKFMVVSPEVKKKSWEEKALNMETEDVKKGLGLHVGNFVMIVY